MSREGLRKWSENVFDGGFVRFTTRWQNGAVTVNCCLENTVGVLFVFQAVCLVYCKQRNSEHTWLTMSYRFILFVHGIIHLTSWHSAHRVDRK